MGTVAVSEHKNSMDKPMEFLSGVFDVHHELIGIKHRHHTVLFEPSLLPFEAAVSRCSDAASDSGEPCSGHGLSCSA